MVGAAVALALQVAALSGPVLATDETLLETSAEGSMRAVPDIASFTGGITSDGTGPAAAPAASARTISPLVEAARGAGAPPADPRTVDLTVRPSRLRVRITRLADA